eukprot:GHVR01097924.1.p2 GENE.GHVR01097924.1~~GHVR01097924.1.p2  ORF type:complete len:127 (-),score=18.00 GHVR01097924.1:67-447(-)
MLLLKAEYGLEKKAKELGLVDDLGNVTDAIMAAAKLAKLDKYDTLLIENEPSSRNKFIQKIMGQVQYLADFSFVDNATASELSTLGGVTAKPMTQFINQLQAEFTKMNQFNDPQGMYTLCLACSVQ